MFSRKTLYYKTEKIHHRTLKVIYQSEESYENLSQKFTKVDANKS